MRRFKRDRSSQYRKCFYELVCQSSSVCVVDEDDRGGVVSFAVGQACQYDALRGIGYRRAEEQVVILQHSDRRRSRSGRYLQPPMWNSRRLGHGYGHSAGDASHDGRRVLVIHQRKSLGRTLRRIRSCVSVYDPHIYAVYAPGIVDVLGGEIGPIVARFAKVSKRTSRGRDMPNDYLAS